MASGSSRAHVAGPTTPCHGSALGWRRNVIGSKRTGCRPSALAKAVVKLGLGCRSSSFPELGCRPHHRRSHSDIARAVAHQCGRAAAEAVWNGVPEPHEFSRSSSRPSPGWYLVACGAVSRPRVPLRHSAKMSQAFVGVGRSGCRLGHYERDMQAPRRSRRRVFPSTVIAGGIVDVACPTNRCTTPMSDVSRNDAFGGPMESSGSLGRLHDREEVRERDLADEDETIVGHGWFRS